MKSYRYTALKNNKEIISGEINASDIKEARSKIRELGFLPTKIYTEKTYTESYDKKAVKKQNDISFLSLDDKIIITSELETILSSEISILEALSIIENHVPNEKLRIICSTLKKEITNGMTFHGALEKHYAKAFGFVYLSLVKTGEETGELDITMGRMLSLLKKERALKDKITIVSIYPAILTVILFAMGILFSKFVFPRVIDFITTMGNDLPPIAQALTDIVNYIDNYWWFIILFTISLVYGIKYLFNIKIIKDKWDEFVLKIPKISDFVRYVNLSNFISVLQISYEAGVPILSGLELSKKTINNKVIKDQVSKAIEQVKKGEELTIALSNCKAIPYSISSIMLSGEKAGKLGAMLKDASNNIDKKIDMVMETLAQLFPPLMILILGGIVLFVALGFIQMYYTMYSSLF